MSKTPRLLTAFLLGLLSIPLLFLLAEGVRIPSSTPAAEFIHRGIFVIGMGAYFFMAEYLLSHGNPEAVRKDWPIILALTLPLIVSTAIAFVVEPNKSAVIEVAGTALLAVASSFAGAVLAARAASH